MSIFNSDNFLPHFVMREIFTQIRHALTPMWEVKQVSQDTIIVQWVEGEGDEADGGKLMMRFTLTIREREGRLVHDINTYSYLGDKIVGMEAELVDALMGTIIFTIERQLPSQIPHN